MPRPSLKPPDAAVYTGDIYGKVTPPPRMTVRMNEAGWRKYTERVGVDTDAVLGAMLGFQPSSVHRIRHGKNAPSSEFIAQAIQLLDAPFDDLFAVVTRPAQPAAKKARKPKAKPALTAVPNEPDPVAVAQ